MHRIPNIIISDPSLATIEIQEAARRNIHNAQKIRETLLNSEITQNPAFNRLEDIKLLELVLVCLAYSALNPETANSFKNKLIENTTFILKSLNLQAERITLLSLIEHRLLEILI